MLQQALMRNRKFRSDTWPRGRARSLAEQDVNQQQGRKRQAYDEMNPTRPGTQSFATGVIKTISSDDQNGERTQKNRSVCSIPMRAPCESHMRVQEHPDQY